MGTLLFILLVILVLAVLLGAGGYSVRRYWSPAGSEVVETGDMGSGAGAGVAVIEEEDPCPDRDRTLVVAGEVMVEPGQEELFDARIAISLRGIGRRCGPGLPTAGRSTHAPRGELPRGPRD